MKAPEMLRIVDLTLSFETMEGATDVLNRVNLSIAPGERLCLLGESGSGKSMVALSMMGLLPRGCKISGQILWKGRDLIPLGDKGFRQIRGQEIGMIFEQPATCIHPCFSIGDQVAEVIRVHQKCSAKTAKKVARDLMGSVGLLDSENTDTSYVHQLSGGMQQRAMIAAAMASRPSLLIADEPTSALDVTIQAQIIEVLQEQMDHSAMALLLISHDLRLAAELCQRAAVMYAGEIVEEDSMTNLYKKPRHPYTQALLGAVDGRTAEVPKGSVSETVRPHDGCRFHPRCVRAGPRCWKERPSMRNGVRCHLWGNRS